MSSPLLPDVYLILYTLYQIVINTIREIFAGIIAGSEISLQLEKQAPLFVLLFSPYASGGLHQKKTIS
jgi:hypothetical protein